MRPRGTPPTPSARSSETLPVEMAAMSSWGPSPSPSRITEPLPNCFSMAETASSIAFSFSGLAKCPPSAAAHLRSRRAGYCTLVQNPADRRKGFAEQEEGLAAPSDILRFSLLRSDVWLLRSSRRLRRSTRRLRRSALADAEKLDLEDEGRAGRNARPAHVAVGGIGGADELRFLADLHLGNSLRPALDDAGERELHRLSSLVRAVEDGAVDELAFVVDLDLVRLLRRRPGSGLH